MIALTGEEAGEALGVGVQDDLVGEVSIDSRTIRPGSLFIAVRGQRVDGHAFLGDAFAAGACGAVVSQGWWADGKSPAAAALLAGLPPESRRCIYAVEDTLHALGALAKAVRKKSQAKVIAITGSVGKTGTKDILGAMVGRVRRVVLTAANQNNEIGVPLTLLAIQPDTEIAIIEMGMRGKGQIASLADIAEPDVGLITNIHPVHLELLGTLEDVAEAKAELIAGIKPGGVAVIPADCSVLHPYAATADCRVIRFGLGPRCDEAEVRGSSTPGREGGRAELSLRWPDGQVKIDVPFVSRHRLENCVAAAATCYGAGLPVGECVEGLKQVNFTPSRGDLVQAEEWLAINDTYNASPAAVRAALDDLVETATKQGGRPVAVLGDMLELGPESSRFHDETGAYAARVGVQVLWGVGQLSRFTVEGYQRVMEERRSEGGLFFECDAGHVESVSDIQPVLASLRPGDVVLFKASRTMKLESMLSALVSMGQLGVCHPGGSLEGREINGV